MTLLPSALLIKVLINLDYSRVEVAVDFVAKSVANVAILFYAKG